MSIFSKRAEKAQKLMAEQGVDWLFVQPGTDMQYMTDYKAHKMERLVMLCLPVEGKPSFITPGFEVPRFKLSGVDVFYDLLPWEETDDPMDHVANLVGDKPAKIAIDEPTICRIARTFDIGDVCSIDRLSQIFNKMFISLLRFYFAPASFGSSMIISLFALLALERAERPLSSIASTLAP